MSDGRQEWPEHAGDRTIEAPIGRPPSPPPGRGPYPGQPAQPQRPGHPQQPAHPQQPQYGQPQYAQRPAAPPPAAPSRPPAAATAPPSPAGAVLPPRFWLKLYAVTLAAVLTGGLILMAVSYELVSWKINQLSDDVRGDISDISKNLGDLGGLPGLGG